MIESRSQITVRYAETDMMGIVYHGSYLPWFEVGRTTLLKECGIIYRDLEKQGFRLPVIELGTKFFKPALYDDNVTYRDWQNQETPFQASGSDPVGPGWRLCTSPPRAVIVDRATGRRSKWC